MAAQRVKAVRHEVSGEDATVIPIAEASPLNVSVQQLPGTDGAATLTEVTVSRSYKINPGNYEAQDSFVALKYTVSDATDMVELGERAQRDMDSIQAPDLYRILDFILEHDPKNKKSLIHSLAHYA